MYNKNFIDSLPLLWRWEVGTTKKALQSGGLVNDPDDKGGITKWGISYRFYKSIFLKSSENSIINLTQDEAINIYWDYFYSNHHYDKINNFELSRKLFLTCVNMGKNRPNRWIQQICNELGSKLTVDGILGNLSIEEINKWTDVNINKIKELFIEKQIAEYNRIVSADATQKKFLKGWTSRAKDF